MGDVRGQGVRLQPQDAAGAPHVPAPRREGHRRPGRGDRGRRRVRRAAAADLPGLQAARLLADRQGRRHRPAQRAGRGGPAARGAARGTRIRPAAGGAAQDPPPADQGGHRRRAGPAALGRGLRAPGRTRPPPLRRHPAPRGGPQIRPRRPARRLRRQAALHPHRRPAEGHRGDLRRSGDRTPDAPAAAGRGGVGKDDGCPARDAHRRRRGRPGRDARPHRGARPATPPLHHRDDGGAGRRRNARGFRSGDQGRPAHRFHGHGGPPARPCSTSSRARPGSSSAPTR